MCICVSLKPAFLNEILMICVEFNAMYASRSNAAPLRNKISYIHLKPHTRPSPTITASSSPGGNHSHKFGVYHTQICITDNMQDCLAFLAWYKWHQSGYVILWLLLLTKHYIFKNLSILIHVACVHMLSFFFCSLPLSTVLGSSGLRLCLSYVWLDSPINGCWVEQTNAGGERVKNIVLASQAQTPWWYPRRRSLMTRRLLCLGEADIEAEHCAIMSPLWCQTQGARMSHPELQGTGGSIRKSCQWVLSPFLKEGRSLSPWQPKAPIFR